MLLDIFAQKFDPSIIPSRGTLPTTPKSFGERFDLAFDAFMKTEQAFSEERLKYEAYENAVQELYSATGRRVENPYAGIQERSIPDDTGLSPTTSTRDERVRILSDALREAREKHPSLPDPDEIEANAGIVAKQAHDAAFNAGLVSSGWTGFAAFAGSVAGAFADPVNLATLPLGAGRVTGSLALRILKTAAVEAGIAGGTQALIEAATYDFKTESGIEPTPAFNILAAATGGAVLGGGVRGLIDGIRNIKARSLGLSLDEMDALHVAERNLRDVESNPLGPARVEEHINKLQEATRFVIRGEGFDIESLRAGTTVQRVMSADTDIRLARSEAIETVGMPLRERIAQLEAEARKSKPETFAEIDKISARLSEIEERQGKIDEALGVTTPEEVVAARKIAEINAELATGNIDRRRAKRLERIREETLDGRTEKELLDAEKKYNAARKKADKESQKLKAEAKTLADEFEMLSVIRSREIDKAAKALPVQSRDVLLFKFQQLRDEPFVPGPIIRRERMKQEAAKSKETIEATKQPEYNEAMVLDAQRIAADFDVDVPTETGTIKASRLLEEINERNRVANEISDACLLGSAAE